MASATTNPSVSAARKLPLTHGRLWLKIFYGIGSVAWGVKDNGFQVLLLLFYNQVLGLDARLAGLAIMIALVVDACMDPTIGYLSDRTRSRLGRRHPFMYAAAVPVAVCYLLLFSAPAGLGQWQLFAYLLVVAVLVRILIAVYEVPSSALVAELTQSYDERTDFLSFRFFFGWFGGLSMGILAFSIFLRSGGTQEAPYLVRAGYWHYGVAASLIMLCSILLSSVGTQSAVMPVERMAMREEAPRNMLAELWAVLRNRSALSMLGAGLQLYLATGLSFALGTYFYIYAYQLTNDQISWLTSSSFVSATLSLFLAPWVARRLDKRSGTVAVTVGLIVSLPLPLIMGLLGLLPSNASGALLPALVCFNIVVTTLFIIAPTLIFSMLADVVEEVEIQSGLRVEGIVFALTLFMQKSASGLGLFASTWMLAAARFPTHARAGEVPPGVITTLSVIFISTVGILYIGTLACVASYRITRATHQRNLQELAARRVDDASAERSRAVG